MLARVISQDSGQDIVATYNVEALQKISLFPEGLAQGDGNTAYCVELTIIDF